MILPRLTVNTALEGIQRVVAKSRGQELHAVNLRAIERGLRSRNHGARRRAERQLLRAVKRGVVEARS